MVAILLIVLVAIVVVPAILFIQLANLRKRVNDLELRGGKVGVKAPGREPFTPTYEQAPSYQSSSQNNQAAQVSLEPTLVEKFLKWFAEDWLLKLGALLLLIGFGWFASYAFLHNWIGPVGRITAGLIAGVLILMLGWWRIRNYLHQGGIFLVLGSTTILLTIYAAREIYDFFTPSIALIVMFLSALVVTVASVRHKSKQLAILSIALAGIAPLLTNSPTADYVSLFNYLLVVSVAAIWVVTITGWRELVLESLLVVTLYSSNQFFSFLNDQEVLLLYAYVFTALFFVTSVLGIHKARSITRIDGINAIGIGLFLLGWVLTAAKDEWQSLILAAWAVVFMVGASLLHRRIARIEPLYIYAGVGLGLIAAATAVELDGPALTIAYTIETALALALSYVLTRNWRTVSHATLLLLGPIALSIESMFSNTWRNTVLHNDFFVILLLGLVLLATGYIFWRNQAGDESGRKLAAGLLSLGSIYLYILLWLSLHAALIDDDRAVMSSLLVYTIIGLVCYFSGKARAIGPLRRYGAIMLGLVVTRLLVVDVWKMELTGRIITFFAVGALLMSTAFIGRQKKTSVGALLILICLSGTLPVKAQVPANDPELLSAFRQYLTADNLDLQVPTVVELHYGKVAQERPQVVVLDEIRRTFLPHLVTSDEPVGNLRGTVYPSLMDAQDMLDRDYGTYQEFNLPADGETGHVRIGLTTDRPISSNSLNLYLEPYVALPTHIQISVLEDGREKIVVARKELKTTFVQFPQTRATTWYIDLDFSQPLRISELGLNQSSQPDNSYTLRFLAQPNSSYKIYYNPDRQPKKVYFGEMGNLALDTGVNEIGTKGPFPNPVYVISDIDKDGVPDITDNCVSVENRDQEDVNGNGRGEACEDYDRDGILAHEDNCPELANHSQTDTDGDKIGDVCDQEESRLTEKYPWLPWVGIAIAATVLIAMLVASTRPPHSPLTPNS